MSYYYVQPGDTLSSIAARFGLSMETILRANIICNPNRIFIGQLLIFPVPGVEFPQSGALPYYRVLPGDTLTCLARRFNTTPANLVAINQLGDPNLIFYGQELLIGPTVPDPRSLQREWAGMGGVPCEELSPLAIHGIYYLGSFRWQALGFQALPYLFTLLEHPCDTVRYWTIVSLARIAVDDNTRQTLAPLVNDPNPAIAQMARIALRRIDLWEEGRRQIHLTHVPASFLLEPELTAPAVQLPLGSELRVVRYRIASPTAEEGPRGGLQIYDQVTLLATGQTGFIPRSGFDEIPFV